MRAILHLMIRALVLPFYKNHAGLLFFVFFLMFGIVESTQLAFYHQSLIYGMLSSGIILLVVLMIWLLYQLSSHFTSCLKHPMKMLISFFITLPYCHQLKASFVFLRSASSRFFQSLFTPLQSMPSVFNISFMAASSSSSFFNSSYG